MESLADALRFVNIVAFAVLAVVCFRLWRRRGGAPAWWAFLTFGLLAAVALAGLVTDETGDGQSTWVGKLIVSLVVLFPYFLYRFAASFRPPRREVEWVALALTAAIIVWSLALPEIPEEGAPRPGWFVAFIAGLLVQWVALSTYVAARLWWAGRAQPSVVRYRMRVLSSAAIALSVVLVLVGSEPGDASAGFELAERLLTLTSAVLFFVGFAPPRFVRKIWRTPAEEMLRRSVDDLMAAATPDEVTRRVLPSMANMVGARGVALLDEEGRVLGSHGLTPAMREELGTGEPKPFGEDFSGPAWLQIPSGSIVAWTSPYAPFFGDEEFELLHSLGGFAMLALERSRLFAREREARIVLERADELKNHFIAIASHELRTPTAVVHGIASTLHLRGDKLTDEQRHQLRATLYEQTDRLQRLVEQLLDLSRLEAEAVRILPERLPVRRRLEELVLLSAGERAGDVAIDVDPRLEAVADPDAFDRILSNLIANACRYGAPPIRVTAAHPDRYFRVTVEDHGQGVPPDFVPQLFERFTRSRPSQERTGGAGLGLAIAQSYAHAHGGEILYEDAEPHGARFQLVLPRPNGSERV